MKLEAIEILRQLMPECSEYNDASIVGEAADRGIITAREWYEISKEIN